MPNISFRATMRKSACTRQYTQVAVTLAWYSWCQCLMKCVPSVGFWSSLQLVLYFSETCYSKLHVCYCSSSLFWQRETLHDNNRRHEGDLGPRITRGKSFSLFCLYLSPRLLTLRLRLHLWLHLAHWFFFSLFIHGRVFAELACSVLSNALFHIQTVAHLLWHPLVSEGSVSPLWIQRLHWRNQVFFVDVKHPVAGYWTGGNNDC